MPPQPQPDYGRIILIIVVLFFFYSSPDQGAPPGFISARDYAAERIARSRRSLEVLNSTKWQDFFPKSPSNIHHEPARYLNLTGFREEDDFAWERLDAFKKRSAEHSLSAGAHLFDGNGKGMDGALYENVTGVVVGRWVRYTDDLNGEQRRRVMNLTEISPLVDWAYRSEELWTRNITGNEGKMQLRVEERDEKHSRPSKKPTEPGQQSLGPSSFIREVSASLTVQDESSNGDGWEMRLHGVHWPKQGVIIMTSTSEKFAGIFGVPHFAPTTEHYSSSQTLLNETLERTVESMEQSVWADPSNPWTSSPNSQGDATMPAPHCEFIVYVQVHSLKVTTEGYDYPNSEMLVQQIERELRYPQGAPVPEAPKLQMSAVMFSPDCGFMLESKGPPAYSPAVGLHLVGRKQEVLLENCRAWLATLTFVVFGQLWLLKVQSNESSTPSTISRVSLYTITMMLIGDVLLFGCMSLLGVMAPYLFPATHIAAFCAITSVGLGVRFVGAVYNVQEPERLEQLRLEEAAEAARIASHSTPAPLPIITGAGADILPRTAIPAPIDNRQVMIPSDQDIDAEIQELTSAAAALPLPTSNTPGATQTARRNVSNFGAVYVKIMLTAIVLLFTSLSAASWSVAWRTGYTHILSLIYLSFWLPQIRRNVIRNCRKALLWKFIVGQSFLRLLPFAYFYLKEDNIMYAQTDWKAFCMLAGWVWLQIWILVAQEVLGPRWGIPSRWTEQAWDYHPILREDNVEAGGLPIGLVRIPSSPSLSRVSTGEESGRSKKREAGMRSVDCAICMNVLEVPVVTAGEDVGPTGMAGMLARRLYMVTPCRHVFHSVCLEGWMRFRLQCPICRENIPPL